MGVVCTIRVGQASLLERPSQSGTCIAQLLACAVHQCSVTHLGLGMQFLDFCKHYRELRSMGFPAAAIAGALVSHKCDIAAATEACLAAQ